MKTTKTTFVTVPKHMQASTTQDVKKISIRVQAILPTPLYKKVGLKLVERDETWQAFLLTQCKRFVGEA